MLAFLLRRGTSDGGTDDETRTIGDFGEFFEAVGVERKVVRDWFLKFVACIFLFMIEHHLKDWGNLLKKLLNLSMLYLRRRQFTFSWTHNSFANVMDANKIIHHTCQELDAAKRGPILCHPPLQELKLKHCTLQLKEKKIQNSELTWSNMLLIYMSLFTLLCCSYIYCLRIPN